MESDIRKGPFVLRISQKINGEFPPKKTEKWTVLGNIRSLIHRENDRQRHVRGAYRTTIVKNLEELIEDNNADLRYESLVLLCEAIPHFGDRIDLLLKPVFPKVIRSLGHWDLDIRLVAIHLICVYLKYTTNLQNFLKVFVEQGIESPVSDIRRGSLISISTIFDLDMAKENLFILVKSLGMQLVTADPSFFFTVYFAMRKINQVVGNEIFYDYLDQLEDEMAILYQNTLNGETFSSTAPCEKDLITGVSSPNEGLFKCGFFDPYILEQVKSSDVNMRTDGVQRIRDAIQAPWNEHELEPRLDELLLLLGSLLCDRSKKIRLIALDVMEKVVQKIGYRLGNHLNVIVAPLMKNFGFRESRISKLAVRVVHQLMREIHPMPVIRELLSLVKNQRSTVREETINRITAALLSFPPYNFDLPYLCHTMIVFLNETIPRLRQAVVECLVVLAKLMENVGCVISEESREDRQHHIDVQVDEILSIVEVRAAHQILPTCSTDGLVRYSRFDPQQFEVLLSKSSVFSEMQIHRDLEKNVKPKTNESSRSGSIKRKSSVHSNKSAVCNVDGEDGDHSKSFPLSHNTTSDIFEGSTGFAANVDLQVDGSSHSAEKKLLVQSNTKSVGEISNGARNSENEIEISCFSSKISAAVDARDPQGSKGDQGENFSFFSLRGNDQNITNDYFEDGFLPPESPKSRKGIERGSGSSLSLKQPLDYSSFESQECLEIRACCEREESNSEVITDDSPNITLPQSTTYLVKTDDTDSEAVLTVTPWQGDVSCSSRNSVKIERARNLWEACNSVEEESGESSSHVPSSSILSEFTTSVNTQSELDTTRMTIVEEENLNRTFISPSTSTPKKSAEGKSSKITSFSSYHQSAINVACNKDLELDISKDSKKRRLKRKGSKSSKVLFFNDGQEMPLNSCSQPFYLSTNRSGREHQEVENFSSTFKLPPIVIPENPKCPAIVREQCPSREMIYLPPINLDDSNTLVRRHGGDYEHGASEDSFSKKNPRTLGSNRESVVDSGTLENNDLSNFSGRENHCYDPDTSYRSSSKRKKRKSVQSKCSDGELSVALEDNLREKNCLTQDTEGGANEDVKGEVFDSEEARNPAGFSLGNASEGNEPNTKRTANCMWEIQFEESVQNVKPLINPQLAVQLIKQAYTILCGNDWKMKIEAMLTVISVAKFHPFALEDSLQQVFTKLIAEVKTSKPSLAGAAMLTIGHLFLLHRKALDPHVKVVVSAFLSKCGTKTFASSFNVVIKSMFYMLHGMQPQKAALAFLNVGCRHPNKAVRETAAQFLTVLVEKLGPIKSLQSSRNLTDNLLNCAANFVTDGSPLTRYCGKRIFQILMKHQNFMKSLNKSLPENGLRNIHRILEVIRTKGLAEEVLPVRQIWPDDI